MTLKKRLTALLPGWARRAYRRFRPQVTGRRLPVDRDIAASVPFPWIPVDIAPPGDRLAVVCHIFHADQAAEIRAVIDTIPFPTDIYASTDTDAKRAEITDAFAGHPGAVDVRLAPNRGRDVAPRLITFADVYARDRLVLFLHAKRSAASSIGAEWRDALIGSLAGSADTVRSIVAMFDADATLGLVMAEHIPAIRAMIGWYANYSRSAAVARRMGIEILPDDYVEYPAGSMFWARSAALRPLLDLNLGVEDFPPEAGQLEDTLQHAIERLMLHAAEQAGYRWAKVAAPDTVDDPARLRTITDAAALDAFLADSRFRLTRPRH